MYKNLYILLFLTTPAFAYLDPGTGSMLLSAIVGLVATLLFSLKSFYYKIQSFVYGILGKKIEKSYEKLVFYSEGGQYWFSFKSVLEELDKQNIKALYLTSDEADQGLKFQSDNITTRYIGEGNRAYTYLNMLEADVVVMTTPGLDVLQIRRSKGVKHYAHIVHAISDMALYKLYSFDYYDSILCSGDHQKRSLRELENLRGTEQKLLLDSGCPYIDEIAKRVPDQPISDQNTILLAPTWGANGLLTKFGKKLISSLLETDMKLIIRPHPQSYISESELMSELENHFKDHKNLTWDKTKDNFESLMNSSVMISDFSGVVFDYAFVFEKPVITLKFELDYRGFEANDLPYQPWEMAILDKLGKQIDESEIANLPNIIKELLSSNAKENLRDLREKSIYNYKNSGKVIADQLVELMEKNR